jgi:hypothetical protein
MLEYSGPQPAGLRVGIVTNDHIDARSDVV